MKTYETEQRRRLAEYLAEHQEIPMSAEEIAKGITEEFKSDKTISVSSVYRNLAKLLEAGKVREFRKDDGRTALYQYTDPVKCSAHLHMKCTVCGKLFHMDNKISETLLQSVLESSAFSIDGSKTVLYGVCSHCR